MDLTENTAADGNRAILLTGASGVVGSQLRQSPTLAPQLLLARHRTNLPGHHPQILIDITKPQLGLSTQNYRHLIKQLSAVIHCAALTEIGGPSNNHRAINVDGVRHMVALAQEAEVPFHYISTAFCSSSHYTSSPQINTSSAYITSKQEAETIVRNSSLDWTIIRPSIIVGHSETGAIASFQGFHMFLASIVSGRIPFLPLVTDTACDLVPVDYVARGIEKIVSCPDFGRTYWLTAGKHALTITDMLTYGKPFAHACGVDLETIKILDPAGKDRAMINFINSKLPKGLRERLDMLMEMANVMAVKKHFPSDLENILHTDNMLSSEFMKQLFERNIHYWGQMTNKEFEANIAA